MKLIAHDEIWQLELTTCNEPSITKGNLISFVLNTNILSKKASEKDFMCIIRNYHEIMMLSIIFHNTTNVEILNFL